MYFHHGNGTYTYLEKPPTKKEEMMPLPAKYEGMNAVQVVQAMKAAKEQKPSNGHLNAPLKTGEALKMTWVKAFANTYGSCFKQPTLVDQGKLGRIAKGIGREKAKEVIEFAITHWSHFCTRTKYDKGIDTVPSKPTPGFLLMYYDVAMGFDGKRRGEIDS